MRDVIAIFKALSDETRLRILSVLLERECCVCEVEQALGISQSRASRNLRILERAGLVRDRRDGAWKVYSVTPDAAMAPVVGLVAQSLEDSPALRKDKDRLTLAERRSPEGAFGAPSLPGVAGG